MRPALIGTTLSALDQVSGSNSFTSSKAGFDEHSHISPVTIAEDGSVEFPSELKPGKRVGPTQAVSHEFGID